VTLTSTLAEHAFGIVVRDLEGFGNRLNDQHRHAVGRMLETYSSMACGEITGRFAFDLPTGCGKTQSVIAWCQAVHETQTGLSAVIATSKVEELCDIKRKLTAKGVPEESIGLIHSKKYDCDRTEEWLRMRDPSALKETGGGGPSEYASLPKTTDNETRPFLLVTHSRVQSRRTKLDLLNTFEGRPRNLVFWDESLLVSDGRGISKREIESALDWLIRWTGGEGPEGEVVVHLRECVDLLSHELYAQKRHRREPHLVRSPRLSDFELRRYSKLLDSRLHTRPLSTFLKLNQSPLRVIPISLGEGAIVTYDIALPRELDNVVILDASYPIRRLERLDPSIQAAPEFNGAVKRYDKVVINHLRHGCGRGTMERSFEEEEAEARLVSRELCDVIAGIDQDEGVIVFTFKAAEVDMREVLKRDLKVAGIDTKAMLKPASEGVEPKPRFRFLTWGQETAINDHCDCPNVVFAGVIHRSETDLAAAIVGQQDNLLAPVTGTQLVETRRSENVHALYQAMSRGSCRETVDGQARPMRVWLIHYDKKLPALVDKVMPGVRWETWRPKFVDPIQTKVEDVALKVLAYLRHLSPEITKVSTRKVKDALGLIVPPRTFTRAVQCVSEADAGWFLLGRSLQRAPFEVTV
jgi:hypothetical protein